MSAPAWSDQSIDDLKRHHAEGLSSTEIATLLNTTRNAVCGKIHRLHLATPVSRTNKPVAQRKPRKRSIVVTMSPLERSGLPLLTPKPRTPATNKPVSLLDAGSSDCRTIVGHDAKGIAICCGLAKCEDRRGRPSQYCAEHHQLFHTASVSR